MTAPLQLSTNLPTFAAEDPGSWQHVIDAAVAADEAGIDRVVMSDHVVFGENLEAYADPSIGGQAGGKQPTGPDGHWLEPVATIAHLTALTSRLRFGTNILIAALRRPVVLAKQLATIDVLSGGRLDIGVGVGWQREEYEAAGLGFEGRGRLLDETLEVCQTLWREQTAAHRGPTLTFERIHMMPKPVQPGGVPLWVSGTVTPPAMRRLAKFGAGWIPWGKALGSAEDLLEEMPKMRDAVASHGRDPTEIQIAGAAPLVQGADGAPAIGPTMERVRALVEAGVTDVRATLPTPADRHAAEDYLAEWVAAFRAATA